MTDDDSIQILPSDDSGLHIVPAMRLFGQHGDPEEDPQGWSTVSTSSVSDSTVGAISTETTWRMLGVDHA